MKRIIFLTLFFCALAITYAQIQLLPRLSTADVFTIQSQLRVIQEAKDKIGTVIREWNQAHPVYRINPQTYQVEATSKPSKGVVKPTGIDKQGK